MTPKAPIRILVIDDQQSIHDDFRKIIETERDDQELSAAAAELFGEGENAEEPQETFEINSAHQGQEGLAMVARAVQENRPYPLAFVDVRMPPGWDGVRDDPAHLDRRSGNPHRALHRLFGPHLGRHRPAVGANGPLADPEEAVRQHRGAATGDVAHPPLAPGPPGGNHPQRTGTDGARADRGPGQAEPGRWRRPARNCAA